MTASVPQSGKFKVSKFSKNVLFSQETTTIFNKSLSKNRATEPQNVWRLGVPENAKRTGACFGGAPKERFGGKKNSPRVNSVPHIKPKIRSISLSNFGWKTSLSFRDCVRICSFSRNWKNVEANKNSSRWFWVEAVSWREISSFRCHVTSLPQLWQLNTKTVGRDRQYPRLLSFCASNLDLLSCR